MYQFHKSCLDFYTSYYCTKAKIDVAKNQNETIGNNLFVSANDERPYLLIITALSEKNIVLYFLSIIFFNFNVTLP